MKSLDEYKDNLTLLTEDNLKLLIQFHKYINPSVEKDELHNKMMDNTQRLIFISRSMVREYPEEFEGTDALYQLEVLEKEYWRTKKDHVYFEDT